jgi:hypothetical protein
MTTKGHTIKAKISKGDYMKLRNFYTAKESETIYRMRSNIESGSSNRGLTSRIHNDLKEMNKKIQLKTELRNQTGNSQTKIHK